MKPLRLCNVRNRKQALKSAAGFSCLNSTTDKTSLLIPTLTLLQLREMSIHIIIHRVRSSVESAEPHIGCEITPTGKGSYEVRRSSPSGFHGRFQRKIG